jgi:hypothetical protein
MQDVVGAGDQKEMVGQLLTRLGNLEAVLWEAEKARRRNHNELIEMKGNIRVFCRLRPCSGDASTTGAHPPFLAALQLLCMHDLFRTT